MKIKGNSMKYKILLFDLDDTLLDFRANEQESLHALFAYHQIPFTKEIFQRYDIINRKLWREYEVGRRCLKEVLETRFSQALQEFGYQIDGREWEARYLSFLATGAQLMPHAKLVCQELSKSHRLMVATNGIRKTQIKRLQKAGMYELFETIFDSESVGAQKPDIAFFHYIAEHVNEFQTETTLMIGDSLHTDIQGANQAGIDSCWYCGHGGGMDSLEIRSTYIIHDLRQILEL